MRTLHLYLTRQIFASLLITVAVFTLVLLLGNVLREILTLLVNRQATLGVVTQAVGLLVPFVWVFALPMGMLTATLLIFGRFSADALALEPQIAMVSFPIMSTRLVVISGLVLASICLAQEESPPASSPAGAEPRAAASPESTTPALSASVTPTLGIAVCASKAGGFCSQVIIVCGLLGNLPAMKLRLAM